MKWSGPNQPLSQFEPVEDRPDDVGGSKRKNERDREENKARRKDDEPAREDVVDEVGIRVLHDTARIDAVEHESCAADQRNDERDAEKRRPPQRPGHSLDDTP